MKHRATALFLAALLAAQALFVPSTARAAYDDVGIGARVTGLGNAYTAVADDVYSVYYNPAGLATLDRKEFGTTYSRLLTGLSDGSNLQNSFLGYAHPLDEGRRGTLGAAWNYFTLDSLYRETSLFASYGRRMTREDRPDPIFAGLTMKFLNRSLGGTSVATNGLSNTGAVVGPDPVLQNTSRSNIDADFGLLWRPQPRWNLGLQVQHLLEPNIAFSSGDSDKLGRNIKFGAAFRTPFTTLSADASLRSAPDGSMDKGFAAAAEKWLPTLLHGSFGVRGGLALGSRDLRQLSMGLSYKIHRMQFDYGFALPIGGLTSTSGSHRVGLTWRFGAPRQADILLGEMLLENLSAPAAVGTPEFEKQAVQLVGFKRKAVDLLMRDADAEAQLGHFASAHERSRQAASLVPRDAVIAELDERYRTSAAYFPDLSAELGEQGGAAIHDGLMKFIAGKDKDALVAFENGRRMKPSLALDGMIRIVEARLGGPQPQVPPAPTPAPSVAVSTAPAAPAAAPETSVAVSSAPAAPTSGADALKRILDSTSALLEVSFFQQEWDKAIKLAEQVIALDPGNIAAYKRLAGAYHALKKYPEAMKSLKAAYALEPNEDERRKLRSYIDALRASMETRARPVAATPRPAAAPSSPQDVERLYEAGVELYAQGRLGEASEAFRRCLQLDPNYIPAQRARQRVQAEIMQSGQGR